MKPNKFYTLVSVPLCILKVVLAFQICPDAESAGLLICVGWLLELLIGMFSGLISIRLPFVTDIVKKPTSPVYRLEGSSIVKYEVGYSNDDIPGIVFLFPLVSFLSYKTMVQTQEYWLSDSKYEVVISETKTLREVVEEIEKARQEEKALNNKEILLLNRINKEYEDNFIT